MEHEQGMAGEGEGGERVEVVAKGVGRTMEGIGRLEDNKGWREGLTRKDGSCGEAILRKSWGAGKEGQRVEKDRQVLGRAGAEGSSETRHGEASTWVSYNQETITSLVCLLIVAVDVVT